MRLTFGNNHELRYKILLVFILAISFILMFLNLGDRFTWMEEASTAFFADNILRLGYPSTAGERNNLLVNVNGIPYYKNFPVINGHQVEAQPWLSVYLVAAFFFMFGQSLFVLRFPFALAGILTILMVYLLVKKWTSNSRLAVLSSLLLSLFVPFYLFSRVGRYYSLPPLFSVLILIFYCKMLRKEKFGIPLFVLSGIGLFYSHPASFFGMYAGIIIHFFLFKFDIKILFKSIIPSAFIFFFINLPWLLFVDYTSIGNKSTLTIFSALVSLGIIWAYIFLYIFPFIFAVGLPLLIFKRKKLNSFYCLILLCIFFGLSATVFQPWGFLVPLRYFYFSVPLFMILNAGILLKLARINKYIVFPVIFFLVLSNFLYIFPFKIIEDFAIDHTQNQDAKLFIKDNLQVRYLLLDFLYELTHHYATPNEQIINFLKINGIKDTDVILTNYDHGSLMYGLKASFYQKGIVDEKPDWIILRKPASYADPQTYNFVQQFITSEYEKFVLYTSDYRYQRDDPHPRTHRFKMIYPPIINNDFPHETNFIEIYHLNNTN